MQQHHYQLLIFDWDGTLVDSLGYIIKRVQAAATELNLPVPDPETIRSGVGLSVATQVERLFPGLDPKKFADVYYKHYIDDQLETNFFHGALDTLRALKQQGFYLAIATSKARQSLEYVLNIARLNGLFLATRCGDDGFPKPNPEMLLGLIEEVGVAKTAAVMIGDTIYDMQLAQNAGVDAIAVTYGVHVKEELVKYNPIRLISDIKELLKVVSGK